MIHPVIHPVIHLLIDWLIHCMIHSLIHPVKAGKRMHDVCWVKRVGLSELKYDSTVFKGVLRSTGHLTEWVNSLAYGARHWVERACLRCTAFSGTCLLTVFRVQARHLSQYLRYKRKKSETTLDCDKGSTAVLIRSHQFHLHYRSTSYVFMILSTSKQSSFISRIETGQISY